MKRDCAARAASDDDPLARTLAAAARVEPVSPEALGEAALMNRVDRKYMLPSAILPELLTSLAADYRVLEIGGRRLSHYVTRYFDTPDLALYFDHHNGRAPRFKVRVRSYEGADTHYLEVKRKTAGGRTLKHRTPFGHADELMECLRAEGLLDPGEHQSIGALGQTMTVEYRRMTLVRKTGAERITLDLMLTFRRGEATRVFPNAVIAEVKQDARAASPFVSALRALNIREGAVSKYCAGIASLDPTAKSNRFRPALRRLSALGAPAFRQSVTEPQPWIS